jgi:hypothetical protein
MEGELYGSIGGLAQKPSVLVEHCTYKALSLHIIKEDDFRLKASITAPAIIFYTF